MKNIKYTKEDIKILKNAIKDYEELKQVIEFLKRNIYNIDLDFLSGFVSELISYSGITVEENEYIDFYYKDMLLTISNYDELKLAKEIYVFIPKYIDPFIFDNVEEIKKIVKGYNNHE